MIDSINGRPLARVDPSSFFVGKEQDHNLVRKMKEKYNLTRYKRGLSIASINDIVVKFTTKVLSINILRQMRAN